MTIEKPQFKLPVFEGPLDLLLHLIKKNKLNIYDIPIAELLTQYLAYIEQMKTANMEIASEFLEMAAGLVYMKTVSLLPKQEEMDQLKQELTGRLLEYQLCREMAGQLGARAGGLERFTRQPLQLPINHTYQHSHDPRELYGAYFAAAGKGERKLPPPRTVFEPIVEREIVPVSAKIIFVLRTLKKKTRVKFSSLFKRARNKSEMVATFLAVLELIKAKRIRVDGEDNEVTVINRADG